MATSSKVKVSTGKLLEAVTARRAAIVAEHERALAKYNKDRAGYGEKVCDALRKALSAAEGGRLPEFEGRYEGNRLVLPARFKVPEKPYLNTDQIDRLIATLEIAADETLTISADDAARYLG